MVTEIGPWSDVASGVGGVIDVDNWAEIRRLHRAEGMRIKAIALGRLRLVRSPAREAVRSDAPPRYERPAAGSRVDAFEP